VLRLDSTCKVTGVSDTRVLVASHIKPWKDASNEERLMGHNGILLSPHVDALFDERLVTFEDDGQIQVHPSLSADVLDRWSINASKPVERFRPEQLPFLSHHRRLFAARL
jgi:predicted restriction endonuclease